MKCLVVFYSRTGMTKKVAGVIANNLKCDIEEIIDKKNRKGIAGLLYGGRDATLKRLTEINKIKNNPKKYDIVVIGTPVWASAMVPAIRAYIQRNKDNMKTVAFFCTEGGRGGEDAFKEMQEIAGKKAVALLILKTSEVVKGDYTEKLNNFTKQLKK